MLLRKLRLVNYGGIYNGMHLYEINIDFTKCKNRILLIRGDNGSGKSTIENSLKPLPDTNNDFIPGKTAIKEIEYYDEIPNIIYNLTFIHECKANGERSIAKGYIKKIIVNTGEVSELNPNGNITSCKDIIYEEFQLDPNYITLTQLSSTDRGLADKRPAERKKYVNSILNNTEAYNDIHKKLSKKSLTYKGLMGSIVSKLDSIGDKGKLDAELASLNNQILNLSENNTLAIKNRSAAEGAILEIDPDGSFISKISKIEEDLTTSINKYREFMVVGLTDQVRKNPYISINSTEIVANSNIDDIHKYISDSINNTNQIQRQIESNKKQTEDLLKTREVDASELTAKTNKLQSINSGINYSQCKEIINNCKSRMRDIESRFNGTDIDHMSRDEFVSAIETLYSIKNDISNYENGAIINNVLNNEFPNVVKDIETTKDAIKVINEKIDNWKSTIAEESRNKELFEILKKRPDDCTSNTCPFIVEALKAEKAYMSLCKTGYEGASEVYYDECKNDLKKGQDTLEFLTSYNNARIFVNNITRQISTFKNSLSKIHLLKDIVSDPIELFRSLYMNDINNISTIDNLYSLLDYANDIEEYKVLEKQLNESMSDLKSLESQAEFIELLENDIKNIQIQLDKDIEEIDNLNKEYINLQSKLSIYHSQELAYKEILEFKIESDKIKKEISDLEEAKTKESNKISKINHYRNIIDEANMIIHDTDIKLKPLLERRDMINYQLNLMTQYIQELNEYKGMYDKIETLKYYSSPTTGIQLLFASMYMNKIMENANKLLCNLFGGEFALLPFIITESEFRIPVAVDGGLNHDDITTMSSAQISLLSMIISVSLLSQTSTKLNIIVGDEIDGPFDGDNRRQFFDILYKLMMLVNASQCVLISHNAELPQSDCDVILLKNDNSDEGHHPAGNVIWSYYN